MNMATETFLTTLYTIVDDWYQQNVPALISGRVGRKPTFSDSEVMTLSLAQHWLGVEGEREHLRSIRNNFLPLFPRLISQGQFNRRARGLCWLIHWSELSRQHPTVTICVFAHGSRSIHLALRADEPVPYDPPYMAASPGETPPEPIPATEGSGGGRRLPSLLTIAAPPPEREYTIEVEWVVRGEVTVRAFNQEEALVRAEATEVNTSLRGGTAVRTTRIGGLPVNLVHDDDDDW